MPAQLPTKKTTAFFQPAGRAGFASWQQISTHASLLFLFEDSCVESYQHTPIVHFAAKGKIFLFGKSEVGEERVRADIVDVQELTSRIRGVVAPLGWNTFSNCLTTP